jgi:hypothetical protein
MSSFHGPFLVIHSIIRIHKDVTKQIHGFNSDIAILANNF